MSRDAASQDAAAAAAVTRAIPNSEVTGLILIDLSVIFTATELRNPAVLFEFNPRFIEFLSYLSQEMKEIGRTAEYVRFLFLVRKDEYLLAEFQVDVLSSLQVTTSLDQIYQFIEQYGQGFFSKNPFFVCEPDASSAAASASEAATVETRGYDLSFSTIQRIFPKVTPESLQIISSGCSSFSSLSGQLQDDLFLFLQPAYPRYYTTHEVYNVVALRAKILHRMYGEGEICIDDKLALELLNGSERLGAQRIKVFCDIDNTLFLRKRSYRERKVCLSQDLLDIFALYGIKSITLITSRIESDENGLGIDSVKSISEALLHYGITVDETIFTGSHSRAFAPKVEEILTRVEEGDLVIYPDDSAMERDHASEAISLKRFEQKGAQCFPIRMAVPGELLAVTLQRAVDIVHTSIYANSDDDTPRTEDASVDSPVRLFGGGAAASTVAASPAQVTPPGYSN